MNIADGIKQLRGRGREIPDASRDDLPQFFVDMGYKVGAEIGVLRGAYTEQFCKAGLKMFAIDPWAPYADYRRHSKEEPYDVCYEKTVQHLAPYDCTIIRKTSMEAVWDFLPDSLDFVYIDGNHRLHYALYDIWEWAIRVRPGGVVSGHDYEVVGKHPQSFQACHVLYAVEMYTRTWGIKDWYILGRRFPPEGEHRDKHRSWLWIKSQGGQ